MVYMTEYLIYDSYFQAIKNGDVFIHHNAAFLFSCVNADVVDWLVRRQEGEVEILSLLDRDRSAVGTRIITKSLNGRRYDDITTEYKFQEGSQVRGFKNSIYT